MKIFESILPEIIALRHRLNSIPELKYQEVKTSAYIAEQLKSYGYQVRTGIAKTGLTAIYDGGQPGKTIAIRADMDALLMSNGPMHACGHDGHCATVLAIAKVMMLEKPSIKGKVKFIFQPAEEGGHGSTEMIKAGVLENPKVDAIFGYHNWPGLPATCIGIKSGTILVGCGSFEITVTGKLAHLASPENAINPIISGAELVSQIEQLRKELKKDQVIINIISFLSGDPEKGMSDTAEIKGVYYIDSDNQLNQLKLQLDKLIDAVKKSHRCVVERRFSEFHSATINTNNETNLIIEQARKLFSSENVHILDKPKIASEDFSEYLKHVPGSFFLIGAGENAKPVHTNDFCFNDDVILPAASLMYSTVLKYCE